MNLKCTTANAGSHAGMNLIQLQNNKFINKILGEGVRLTWLDCNNGSKQENRESKIHVYAQTANVNLFLVTKFSP